MWGAKSLQLMSRNGQDKKVTEDKKCSGCCTRFFLRDFQLFNPHLTHNYEYKPAKWQETQLYFHLTVKYYNFSCPSKYNKKWFGKPLDRKILHNMKLETNWAYQKLFTHMLVWSLEKLESKNDFSFTTATCHNSKFQLIYIFWRLKKIVFVHFFFYVYSSGQNNSTNATEEGKKQIKTLIYSTIQFMKCTSNSSHTNINRFRLSDDNLGILN